MPVTNSVAPAPFNLRPFPFWRLEIFIVVRPYAVQLPQCFRFELHRPCGKPLFRPHLQPFIHILFCAFQRGTLRVIFFDILDKILRVLPVGLIGACGKDFFRIRPVLLCFPFAFAKGLHTGQALIRLLVQVFGIGFIFSSQSKRPLIFWLSVEAAPPPASLSASAFGNTLFKVLCVTVGIAPRHFFTAYVCSSLYSLSTSSGRSVGFFLEEPALRHFISMSGYIHDTVSKQALSQGLLMPGQ